MWLKQIALTNFRSYRKQSFEFSESSTLVVGNNATGKTNLLEAVWILATGKSFRSHADTEMIRYGKEIARVVGDVEQNSGEKEELEAILTVGKVAEQKVPRKRYLVNQLGKRRMDYVGKLTGVLFRPEDMELLIGSPAKRREYLDSVLEQVDSEYRRSLLSYKKGLRQRNKLLERIREGEANKAQLMFWDQLLIKTGEVLARKRTEMIEFFNGAFKRERISQIIGGLVMEYDRSVISEGRLAQYNREEIASGMTLVGPHRDDFKITSSTSRKSSKSRIGRNLSVYGSRGEQRLAVLAVKLAELSFVTSKVGEKPVLLLDDIFSELDHGHRQDVLEVVGQQQTIMTVTDWHLVEGKYRKRMEVIEI